MSVKCPFCNSVTPVIHKWDNHRKIHCEQCNKILNYCKTVSTSLPDQMAVDLHMEAYESGYTIAELLREYLRAGKKQEILKDVK